MKMTTILKANRRQTGKRSTLTQLRKGGQLAAVLYGYQTESLPISLNYKETAKVVQSQGYTSVFSIEVDGKKINAVLTDIQRDAIKGHVKHVDFLAVNMEEELEVDVPLTLIGTSIGVKGGGVLTQPNHTIKVKVKPSDMPDYIEVDISELAIGDTLSVRNVRDNYTGFTIVEEDEYTLATVTPPATQDADAANVTVVNVEATAGKSSPDKPGS